MLDSSIYQAEYRKNLLTRGQEPEPSLDFLTPTITIGPEPFLLNDE